MVQTVDPRLNLNLAVIIETEDPSMARGDIRVEIPVGSIGSVDVSHRCTAVASSGSVQSAKRREKCAQFCGNKLISALVLACTMFAMFSEDYWFGMLLGVATKTVPGSSGSFCRFERVWGLSTPQKHVL